jgi:hypothetical protein
MDRVAKAQRTIDREVDTWSFGPEFSVEGTLVRFSKGVAYTVCLQDNTGNRLPEVPLLTILSRPIHHSRLHRSELAIGLTEEDVIRIHELAFAGAERYRRQIGIREYNIGFSCLGEFVYQERPN